MLLLARPQPQLEALVEKTAGLGNAAGYASPIDTVALLQLLVYALPNARCGTPAGPLGRWAAPLTNGLR
eukprot:SAG22_NODE_2646_length_2339_cov_6.228571_2_plen_69_part_00